MIAPDPRLEKALIFVLGTAERMAATKLIVREAGAAKLDLKGKQVFTSLLEEGFVPADNELCIASAVLRVKDMPPLPRLAIPEFIC